MSTPSRPSSSSVGSTERTQLSYGRSFNYGAAPWELNYPYATGEAEFPFAGRSLGGKVASTDVLAESSIADRFAAYDTWKSGRGIANTPSLQQFNYFVRGNTGLNGGGFYAKVGDVGRLQRVEDLLAQTHGHHGFPQALRRNFNRIGITNINNYVYPVNGYEHLVEIHGGPRGGAYNLWWREFLDPSAPYGPATSANALQWLGVHRANGFIIE